MILENQTSESVATVDRIVQLIMDKKGDDVVIIDLRKVTSVADFFVIATGNSNVHVKAIADEVREKIRNELRVHPWHVEGEEGQRWILIDYVDIVVHIFDRQTREYYDIEGLYRDADIRRVEMNY
ncbi:MAG: ribosome silencing factor [Candidatus Latescibacterota bacterium]